MIFKSSDPIGERDGTGRRIQAQGEVLPGVKTLFRGV